MSDKEVTPRTEVVLILAFIVIAIISGFLN